MLERAKESAILCDIDLVLVMFSPAGEPTFFAGERSEIEYVVAGYAAHTPEEIVHRRLESLHALKEVLHDINNVYYMGSRRHIVEDLRTRLKSLQEQLSYVQKRLSFWPNPNKVDDIERIRAMEQALRQSLIRILTHKVNYAMDITIKFSSNPGSSSWPQKSNPEAVLLPEDHGLAASK